MRTLLETITDVKLEIYRRGDPEVPWWFRWWNCERLRNFIYLLFSILTSQLIFKPLLLPLRDYYRYYYYIRGRDVNLIKSSDCSLPLHIPPFISIIFIIILYIFLIYIFRYMRENKTGNIYDFHGELIYGYYFPLREINSGHFRNFISRARAQLETRIFPRKVNKPKLFLVCLQAVRWLQPTPFPRRGPPRVPGRRPTPTAPARIRRTSTLAKLAM